MSDFTASIDMPSSARPLSSKVGFHQSAAAAKHLKKRYAAERRFKWMGIAAIAFALMSLAVLLTTVLRNGATAFVQTHISLDIDFKAEHITPGGQTDEATLAQGDYVALIRDALILRFPDATSRRDQRALSNLISGGADLDLRRMVQSNPSLIGTSQKIWLIAGSDVDMYRKGFIDRTLPEEVRRVKDNQLRWLDMLNAQGALSLKFNTRFFTGADSREPELVGIWGAVVGSALTLFVTIIIAFPLGVMAAIYLEEFAPKNRFTDFIEVNINNLAAVPSIIFGLLGLAVFLSIFGMPRSAPLVGGLVLSLMSLPVMIIASRASLRAVPPSIREAAYGLGASKVQVVMHHVFPLAMPGILTGTIIATAHALGETAPLLMIGMVAFIVGVPGGPLDAATVLPVQVFMWADSPERGFVEKTSAAILVLLVFLLMMNAVAIYLRKRFERRW